VAHLAPASQSVYRRHCKGIAQAQAPRDPEHGRGGEGVCHLSPEVERLSSLSQSRELSRRQLRSHSPAQKFQRKL